jgi:hypothetical protein
MTQKTLDADATLDGMITLLRGEIKVKSKLISKQALRHYIFSSQGRNSAWRLQEPKYELMCESLIDPISVLIFAPLVIKQSFRDSAKERRRFSCIVSIF